eukprot:m.206041 g.206041  ORF g.206041 m.206041 type:complete len:97 (-) comp18888_c0_seq2:2123-2413(-)
MGQVKDMRDPTAVHQYVSEYGKQEKAPDMASLLAVIFGLIGVMMRYKAMAWLALFAAMHCMVNTKTQVDDKQYFSSIMIAVVSLGTNYFLQRPGGA